MDVVNSSYWIDDTGKRPIVVETEAGRVAGYIDPEVWDRNAFTFRVEPGLLDTYFHAHALDLYYGIPKEKELTKEDRIEAAQFALVEAQKHLEELLKPKRFVNEPPVGTKLVIVKKLPISGEAAGVFTTLALREGNSWYTTEHVNGNRRLPWAELERFIGNDSDVAYLAAAYWVPSVD